MANKKGWVTGNIFQEWFATCFVPEVKSYLEKKKQSFKALLINASGHSLIEHPNVNIIFLPPNTTSIIQLMDQGIIATFKMYYLKKLFSALWKNWRKILNWTSPMLGKIFLSRIASCTRQKQFLK